MVNVKDSNSVFSSLVFSWDSLYNCVTKQYYNDADVIYVLFNSISVLAGWWKGDNEKLSQMEPHLLANLGSLDQQASPTPAELVRLIFKINNITLKCLSIGTPKTINFPFVPNGKFMEYRCRNI